MKKWIFTALAAVVFLSGCAGLKSTQAEGPAIAGEEFDMQGEWDGRILVAGQELKITVRFVEKDPLQAEIDIPQQGAYHIALTDISAAGGRVSFSLPAGSGKAVFDGVLTEDASVSRIEGEFLQGGARGTFELTLSKAGAENQIPPAAAKEAVTAPVSQYREEELSLDSGKGILKGTLTLPGGDGPFPAALIIAGSGPTDRDGNSPLLPGKNNSLQMLSESLAGAGIASLRTDKRGVGASAAALGSEADLIFSDYIDDYVKWFEKLKQDTRIGPAGIIGHSEGSLIGAAAALQTESAFMISLAGIGEPAYLTLERQLSAQSPEAAAIAVEIMNSLRAGETVETIPQGFESLFRKSIQPYLISWFSYDPVEIYGRLTIPVMIIQGTTDLQVAMKDAEMLKKGNPGGDLIIIEGMNHVLKSATSDPAANTAAYSNPDLPLADGLMTAVIPFIQKAQ